MSAKAIFYRLHRALFGCPSRLETVTDLPSIGGKSEPAHGRGIRSDDSRERIIILSSCWKECSESCPRFQSMRQTAIVHANRLRKSSSSGAEEADLGNGDREKTEVHDFDANTVDRPLRISVPASRDTKADSIARNRAPIVQNAEGRSEQSNAQRDSSLDRGVHGALRFGRTAEEPQSASDLSS